MMRVAYVGGHRYRRRWQRMPKIWQRCFERRVDQLLEIFVDNPWVIVV
jgi:hypothetical protein